MAELKYTNLNYLNEVSDGDLPFIKQMIGVFTGQIPEFIANMEKFLAEGNHAELGKEAHKAKSSVIIVGMDDLGAKLKKLQLLTEENKETETYPEYVEEFKKLGMAAVKELQDYADTI
jgi:HPt (histidine-containing phosphotransfer) domain-containing protein